MGGGREFKLDFFVLKTGMNLRRNLHVWCKIVKIKKGGVR